MMNSNQPAKVSLFQNRFVRTILLSNVLLQIGIWIRNFSILLFVMEQTGNNPYAVSLISVAEYAPIFLFSFIGGTFADRWRPKRTMVWCDMLSAASVFAVFTTLLFGSWKTIFFATLVSAILSQFSQPSSMKLFKQHVPTEQVQQGMALLQTNIAVFMILGPVFGSLIFQSFGIQTSIVVTGIAFLLSAVVLTRLPDDHSNVQEKASTGFWQDLGDGIRYVKSKYVLTALAGTFAAIGLASGVTQPLGVFLLTERLNLPKENLQWFMMVNGAAMLIGGGLITVLSKKVAPQRLLAIGMLADAIAMAAMGLSTSIALTIVAQFMVGFFFPCFMIGISTLILQNTEQSFIGRVNGVLNPFFLGMMVISMSSAGWLKDKFSLLVVFEAAAAVFIIGLLFIIPLFKLKEPGEQKHTMA
ncbi:putative MFS family arabinose efflux permease [Aneurinibacillus soli]|uniref:2-acyl-glycerophospho-ethanolamine acyltransferase n=1 Tax=Aneurinibacillus soli TaxID=1500254 RepID=A0A0U5AVZ1_9BACL|nr:MFS transporter [Aneurinibacillus soli]PYE58189.1 putative MFS family arabinose efflux permease [Aneurinibacillus soli]BAU27905.1 2-acyl-glycerophospho-ethanolamine acyltransferase [Aneurinibacillus soli]